MHHFPDRAALDDRRMIPCMTPWPTDSASCLSRTEEADRLIRVYGTDGFPRIMEALERQFTILHNRAQVLLALVGIVVTTTGFSGRLIAGTSTAAQVCVILGVGLSLLSAVVVVWGVLHLRWLTQQPGRDMSDWLLTCLRYRDRKTRAYRLGIVLLLTGLSFYVVAIALMLLSPEAHAVPMVR